METSAAILAFCKTMLPAFLGAMVASIIGKARTKTARFVAFIVGLLIAHYGGGAAIEWLGVTSIAMQDMVKFSIGVFGMGIAEQIEYQIPIAIRALRVKFFGRSIDSTRGDLK